jgi:DNA topoisomerase-1
MKVEEAIQLSHKEFLNIHADPQKAAKAGDLKYVSDIDPGITRIKKGTGFGYFQDGKAIRNRNQVDRIRNLVIPPAWTNVWICPLANGHLQATGIDAAGRKQYKYHAMWQTLRNETKFHRLYEFGKVLPNIREQVEKDICIKELSEKKVLAAVISLMEGTLIRVGNENYEKLYGSHGLTTLKDNHVDIRSDEINFSFKGKKGIHHKITLKSKRLARIVKACKDISGKELFQYYDDEGNKKSIDSGAVNNYIKEITQQDFTAKDFRTWAGSVAMLRSLHEISLADVSKDVKKNILAALDEVSKKLGNSRAICKKYYVHPELIRMYEEDELIVYLRKIGKLKVSNKKTELSGDEKILMIILKSKM